MKTAEQTALDHGLCRCDEAYTKRGLTAPDCPYHAFSVEEAMQKYAAQFQPQWIKINSEADLPKVFTDCWISASGHEFIANSRSDGFFCAINKCYYNWFNVTHYAPIIKPQPPKQD